MSVPFVHLHLHTEYSLVDSVIRVKPLVRRVAELGSPAVAITDMGNLFGLIKFYRAAMAEGVKPIAGAELWVRHAPGELARLVLLCQDWGGYRNLTRLISRSYTEGRSQDMPALHPDWFAGASGGLIALSGGREGEIGKALLAGKEGEARRSLERWRRHFPDRFYLELQRTGRAGEEEYLDAAVGLAAAEALPVVATNDCRFLYAGDFEAHEARVCIRDGRTLDDPRRPRAYSEQQYLRSPEEMRRLFEDLPEALENGVQIAVRCNLELELGKTYLPEFPVPEGWTLDEYFAREAAGGLDARLARTPEGDLRQDAARRRPYDERLERELGVIGQMGFAGYFLIVADFVRWAKENGVPVGPGRGSGAGSLVAYALGITDLDPLAYELLFERFLNPERVSMPDFDIDFCMEGRDRVIDYVARRYGRDHVSQIATYGSMAAKAVVRDVGRVFGHPYGYVDRVAKLIPFEIGMTLDKALEQEEDFRNAYERDEEVRAMVDMARKLEGLARNVGKHAGGVVIAPGPLTDFVPLYCETGSEAVVTQFDKDDVEAVGLVKFDFLGLRTLTIIDWALQGINRKRAAAGEPQVDITAVDLADAETFALLRRCATTAVFQLESRGMKDLIRRLQPDRFEDIIALVALFRPGPLQSGMVDDFIDRKHGRAGVDYPHPELAPILRPTYGVILYQEQVMQIAQVLAGYSLGGADLLRRAMGKKKPEEMAKQRAVFVEGAVARGVDSRLATYIFDLMEKFAGYGFNRSHSAAYALVAYQTAWLKAHYPAEFMAAVLSADMDNTDKVVAMMEECRSLGLAVLPPDVHRSGYRFAVDQDGAIRYGLGAIKGVGHSAIEHLLAERDRGGPFEDLADLCRRADLRRVNRRVLDTLVRSGALDSLGEHRAALAAFLPEAIRLAEQTGRDLDSGQGDLFGLPSLVAPARAAGVQAAPWPEEQRLAGEKETLGLYLTGHPFARYAEELAHLTTAPLADVGNGRVMAGGQGNGQRGVVVAGLVVSVRTRNGPRGRMAFVTLDDGSARLEMRVFAEAFERCRAVLVEDRVLVVEGSLAFDEFSEGYQVTAGVIRDLEEARGAYARRLVLTLRGDDLDDGFAGLLARTLEPYREATCPVRVDYERAGARAEIALDRAWSVRPASELIERLESLVGGDRVRLDYSSAGR